MQWHTYKTSKSALYIGRTDPKYLTLKGAVKDCTAVVCDSIACLFPCSLHDSQRTVC